jgi:16S rRNA (cytidine1402-2'-O)-methyltransferase
MAASRRIEGAPDPVDAGRVEVVEQDRVEAAGLLGVARPAPPATSGGQDDTPLLGGVMLAAAPPKRLLLRRRTSTKTMQPPSSAIRSTSPPRQRRLRARMHQPRPSRCAAARASADAPPQVFGLRRRAPPPQSGSPPFPPCLPCFLHRPTHLRLLHSQDIVIVCGGHAMGNLQDMSLRALAVLRAVDAVACEDTRHSQRLLDAFGIKTRLVALHEHNEQAAAGLVIRMLEEGRKWP